VEEDNDLSNHQTEQTRDRIVLAARNAVTPKKLQVTAPLLERIANLVERRAALHATLEASVIQLMSSSPRHRSRSPAPEFSDSASFAPF
jgi:hypothetical protein